MIKKRKSSKVSKLRCAFCQGEGVQPSAERLSCIVCRGRGRVRVKQPYNVCKECGGRGKKKGATLYCLACQGKGFVEEKRRLSLAKSSVSKSESAQESQRERNGLKNQLSQKSRKAKTVKKWRSFFKELLGTFKIL